MYFFGKFKIYNIYVCDLQAQISNSPWSTHLDHVTQVRMGRRIVTCHNMGEGKKNQRLHFQIFENLKISPVNQQEVTRGNAIR